MSTHFCFLYPTSPLPLAFPAFCTQIYLPQSPWLVLLSCSKLLCLFPKIFLGYGRQKALTVGEHAQAQLSQRECIRPVSSLKFSTLEHQQGCQQGSQAWEHWLPGRQLENSLCKSLFEARRNPSLFRIGTDRSLQLQSSCSGLIAEKAQSKLMFQVCSFVLLWSAFRAFPPSFF